MTANRDDLSNQIQIIEKEKGEKLYEQDDFSVNTSEELKLRRLSYTRGNLKLLEEQLQHGTLPYPTFFTYLIS